MDNQPLKNFISFSSKSILASGIIYLLILLVVIAGAYYYGYNKGFTTGIADGMKEGRNRTTQEVQNKISQMPIGQADNNQVLRVSGQIINKSDASSTAQYIIASVANLNRNPLSQATPAQRKILITSNTRIIKKIRKSADQIAKERYEYTQAVKKIRRSSCR